MHALNSEASSAPRKQRTMKEMLQEREHGKIADKGVFHLQTVFICQVR